MLVRVRREIVEVAIHAGRVPVVKPFDALAA